MKTKTELLNAIRRGEVAYTTGGKEVVPDMRPLFAVLKPRKN